MCANNQSGSHGEGRRDGSIRLSPPAAKELHKAFQQMDLLLEARRVEPGLQALMELLRRLRRLRSAVRLPSDRAAG
ncbi:MAG: hypothetical protein JW849_03320 [Phycisphaerae bacterium]|nr:hypothetical protein [Phycisphaerae bacterium]